MQPPMIAGSLRGVALLARFKAEGLAAFTASPAGFVNSLAPLLAFPLIGAALSLVSGPTHADISALLSSVIALLAPPVLSHAVATLWRREAQWLRYAVAFNWCQTVITMAVVLMLLALGTVGSDGLAGIASVCIMLLLVWWIGICWFLASRGLGVNWWQAIAVVVVVNLGTAILTLLSIGPRLAVGGATS